MKSRIIHSTPTPSRRVQFSPEWRGEEAFLIGGGTSVQIEAVNALRDRPGAHVIVLNSSYRAFPWAEMLFFADERWVREELQERRATFEAYPGRVLSILENDRYDAYTERTIRETTPGLSLDPSRVFLHFTATRGAMNVALHMGVRRLVLVGIDNRDGDEVLPNGEPRVHFHEGYHWHRAPHTWKAKLREMETTVAPLAAAGIEVINASPISTLPWWPKVDLAEWLKENPA